MAKTFGQLLTSSTATEAEILAAAKDEKSDVVAREYRRWLAQCGRDHLTPEWLIIAKRNERLLRQVTGGKK